MLIYSQLTILLVSKLYSYCNLLICNQQQFALLVIPSFPAISCEMGFLNPPLYQAYKALLGKLLPPNAAKQCRYSHVMFAP